MSSAGEKIRHFFAEPEALSPRSHEIHPVSVLSQINPAHVTHRFFLKTF
jgi:hypothetical protein